MNLKELRNRIDQLDEKVIKLIIERFEIVEQIMSLKSEVEDKNREREILDKIRSLTENTGNQEFYNALYNSIFTESKRIQNKSGKQT